jgi:hypothetical protein
VQVEPAVVVEVPERDPHAVPGVEDPALCRLVDEAVAAPHVEGLLAEVVGDVEVELPVLVDVDELRGVAPAPVVDAPLAGLLAVAPARLADEEEVRRPVRGLVPGVGRDLAVAVRRR